mmetsp:Transcript_26507/g.56805  ORF Transcript_26507/g.56805 Transcript_26507/m.56805 type:complete len:84 (+) Transcript_26507:791-1042(+)
MRYGKTSWNKKSGSSSLNRANWFSKSHHRATKIEMFVITMCIAKYKETNHYHLEVWASSAVSHCKSEDSPRIIVTVCVFERTL